MSILFTTIILSQGAQEDFSTLQTTLDGANSSSSGLLDSADPPFKDKLTTEVQGLNDKWARVKTLAAAQHSTLEDALQRTRRFVKDVEAVEAQADRVERDHLAREYTVHSYDELVELDDRFKVGRFYQ